MENKKMQRKKSIIDLPSKVDLQIGPFKIINEIGEGEFARVFSGIHEGTDEKVAIKQINKSRLKDESLLISEINIHKKLFHPNICQLYCVMETEYYYFLVMELCPDGNILEIIEKEGAFDEEKACRIFQQIISGLEYLHKNFICHRDMKPENIIIQNKDSKNIKAKIVDFGFSKSFAGDKLLLSPRGSPFYAAPEILLGKGYKGNKIDIWSSGVILYTMVYGEFPFAQEDMKDLVCHITEGKYSLPDTISKNCQDLIKRILQIDPDKRINLYDIKNHPWMKQFKFDLMNSPGIYIDEDILPVDLQIIREMAENNESEIHEYINDIIKNKHNSNTVSYYLRVNKKITKGEISISDLSSASFLFLSYIDNEISKKKYWNDNLDDRVKSLEEELYKEKLIEKESINPKIQLKLLDSNKSEGDANVNNSAVNLQKNISQFKKNIKKNILNEITENNEEDKDNEQKNIKKKSKKMKKSKSDQSLFGTNKKKNDNTKTRTKLKKKKHHKNDKLIKNIDIEENKKEIEFNKNQFYEKIPLVLFVHNIINGIINKVVEKKDDKINNQKNQSINETRQQCNYDMNK